MSHPLVPMPLNLPGPLPRTASSERNYRVRPAQKERTMRHPKLIIAGAGLAAVAAVGGVTAAAATGGTYAGYSTTGHSASTTGHSAAVATVRTASATVAGKTETILVNSGGLPLYYY